MNSKGRVEPGTILGYTLKGKAIRVQAGGDKTEDDTGGLLPQTLEDIKGKTAEELRQIVEIMDAHLKEMHESPTGELRDLSDDEQKAFDLGLEIRETAIKKIEEHRRISEIFRKRPESVKRVYDNIRNGVDGSAGDVRRMTNSEARDRALRVLENRDNSARLETHEIDEVDKQIRSSTDIARRVIVTENEAYREAWMKMITNPNAGYLLADEERDALRAYEEYRAMSEGVSASGGYGIPVFIDPSIILTAQGTSNPFMELARQVNVNTNAWKGVSSAGVNWSFQAEGATVADNSPSLAQPVVNVNMARGFIPYSIEVDQDYPGFAQEMSTLLSAGYDELLVQKFTLGSGTNEPTGLITALTADTTTQVHVQTNGAIGANDPYSAWKALGQRYRRNANWMMSVGVNNAIRQLGTANVYHAYTENIPAAWADVLFGKGAYENAYMADVTSVTGTGFAVVGDFQNYLIARRGGMSVELVPLLLDVTNNRPTGQRGWFAYARIGGGVVNNAGFKLLNNS
jgi:HK97 family phage major capsid protein